MAETLSRYDLGLTTGKIEIDPDRGLVHKQVLRLPDFDGGFNDVPDDWDYQRLVGSSIELLTDKRWPFAEMIPPCKLRVFESQENPSGYECWIDMKLIKGRPLSEIGRLPEGVAGQLAFFLEGCVQMAKVTKKEMGKIVLPDLLGGVKRPKDRFTNLVVDDKGELHFVDVYPLAIFGKGLDFKKGRYKTQLTKAADAANHPKVTSAVDRLKQAL